MAKDASGCLRIQTVRLARNGGPASTEIYKAKVEPDTAGCAGRDIQMPGAPPIEIFDSVHTAYCWRWNGAVNTTECAYSGGFSLSGDTAHIEGPVERPKSSAMTALGSDPRASAWPCSR